MNKYLRHAYVIPEDDANRQLADGFVDHHHVDDRRIKVMPPAGGWGKVLKTFQGEYIQKMRNYQHACVIMLIDFDGRVDDRRAEFEQAIPGDIRPRVFVVGSKDNPETLKNALKISYEEIGESLADDCDAGTTVYWDHDSSSTTMLSACDWLTLSGRFSCRPRIRYDPSFYPEN